MFKFKIISVAQILKKTVVRYQKPLKNYNFQKLKLIDLQIMNIKLCLVLNHKKQA